VIKVIFECNGKDLGETELSALPVATDVIHLERTEEWQKYVVIGRDWIFGKDKWPYVKLVLVEQK
jgi:hypothetical protein